MVVVVVVVVVVEVEKEEVKISIGSSSCFSFRSINSFSSSCELGSERRVGIFWVIWGEGVG